MLTHCATFWRSVYKEKALGDADIDAVYLNGWVAWCAVCGGDVLGLLPTTPYGLAGTSF